MKLGLGQTLLIATDSNTEGAFLKRMLVTEGYNVYVTVGEENHIKDFERCRPAVLVLGFKAIPDSERLVFGLLKHSTIANQINYKTIILCPVEHIGIAYKLCLKEHFDDYVPYWPMVQDSPRLRMAIFNAFKLLKNSEFGEARYENLSRDVSTLSSMTDEANSYVMDGSKTAREIKSGLHSHTLESSFGLSRIRGLISESEDPNSNISHIFADIKRIADRLDLNGGGAHLRDLMGSLTSLQDQFSQLGKLIDSQKGLIKNFSQAAGRVNPSILFVDDDPTQISMFSIMLEGSNVSASYSGSASEAIKKLKKTKPDLIFLDVFLPDINGMELVRLIRKIPGYEKTPVVMITGKGGRDVVVNSLKSGATDFLVKPFSRAALFGKIEDYLNFNKNKSEKKVLVKDAHS